VTPAQAKRIGELVEQELRTHTSMTWPRRADPDTRALLVYSTDALFAYYLDAEGVVYELDMDRFLGHLQRVTDSAKIREVYTQAVARYPELGTLA